MRRRNWDLSTCSTALARALLIAASALVGVGHAAESPIAFDTYEYFPDYAGVRPLDLDADLGQKTRGVIFVDDAKPRDARWLRARFALDAPPDEVQSLYISAANRGVRAFVNGVEIGSTSLSDAEQFGWNYPLFFTIPPALLQAGGNTLDLRLALTTKGWGSLRDVQIGSHALLKPMYDRVLFWRVTGPQITSLVAVLSGAAALLIWLRRRRETVFAWFALACFMAALRNAHFYVSAPISERWYEVWAAVPLHWVSVALGMFALRLCEQRYPKIEKVLLRMLAIWTVAIVVAGTELTRVVVDIGYAWLVIVNVGILAFAVRECERRPRVDRFLLLLAVAVSLLFGALDFTLLMALRDSEWRVYLLPYSSLFLSLVMGAVLVDEFVQARTRQERLNAELDTRLAARERQLREQHQALLKLETERATTSERQRILRDIHDGLGSQLISSIHMVEGGALNAPQVAALLRECVDDLRLAIDSLKPAGNDLLVVLGNFRYRMEPRLIHAGVRLEWNVDPTARSPLLTAEQVLHSLRIVQEAVTNALKHAHPSMLRVTYREGPANEWMLSIADDGVGIADEPDAGGHGLANMRTRAMQAGLMLGIEGASSGTTVTIGSSKRPSKSQKIA